jgi:hypothetical protein
MVEECVVIIGFSKDKTNNSSTPLIQQTTWPSQYNHAPKYQGNQVRTRWFFIIFCWIGGIKQLLKVWWASLIRRTILINRKPLLPTLIPTNHVPIVIFMLASLFHTSSKVATRLITNHKCNKGQKGKDAPNQNLVTKWAPNLSNTLEVKFAWLKVLVTTMVTQVKCNAFGSMKDQKDTHFLIMSI